MDFNKLQLYAGQAPELEPQRREAWYLVGRGKMVMDAELQKHALAIQGFSNGWQTMAQPALADAIKKWRATHSAMTEARQEFTQYIDEAKNQCMSVEREYDPKTNETYKAMTALELKLREAEANKVNEANELINETALYKAHMINQYQELACDYRDKLRALVHDTYTLCLKQKTPPENVQPAINACVAAMRVTMPKELVRYKRNRLSDADASAIVQNLRQPSYADIFNEYLKELNEKFSMYANDLANAEQALANQVEVFEVQKFEDHVNDQAEKQANELYIKATTQVLTAAPGVKPVTETSKIKIGESKEWAAIIIAAFLANFQKCIEKVRVKKDKPDYSTLSVERMAAALDAARVYVDGVEYEQIKK